MNIPLFMLGVSMIVFGSITFVGLIQVWRQDLTTTKK
jgi:hypothetical protein